MAWKDTLLDATFRGVRFDCQNIADAVKRDIQRHAYPYVAGEDTEDLGRSALDITVQAVFWGDDYETRLQTFLKVLEAPGPGELIHPIFGSIEQAQVENWRVEHGAEDPDSSRVTIQFCQSTAAAPFFVRQLPEQKAAQARALSRSAQVSGIEVFARRLQTLSRMRGIVNRLNGLRTTLNRVLANVRSLTQPPVRTVLDVLDFPRTFTSELAEGLRGLIDLRTFSAASLMPGWKGLSAAFGDTVRLPAAIKTGTVPPTFRAQAASVPMGTVPSAPTPVPALDPDDEILIMAVIAVIVACELAEVACDVLASEAQTPTLSPPEIEAIVSDVREAIQKAIDSHRDVYPVEIARPVTEPLKDLALAVQEAGIAVIDARPPLIRRTVDALMNLHLVAFLWYGDYARAEELARLNPLLRHPNFIPVGTVLYAYQR